MRTLFAIRLAAGILFMAPGLNPSLQGAVLVADVAEWTYLHPLDATDPAVADPDFNSTWILPAFDDSGWNSGPGPFGYGIINGQIINTFIGIPDSGDRYSAYFRTAFELPVDHFDLTIGMFMDDGIVIYLDGVELMSRNFVGPDTYFQFALGSAVPEGDLQFFDIPGTIGAGTHTLAVSVHQTTSTSSDLGFGLELSGQPVPEPSVPALLAAALTSLLLRRFCGRGR